MKFIASSGQLLKALQTVGGVIQTNNTLPILDHFLLELSQGQLTLTASDLETTMTTTLDIETEGEITAAIPARILLDTVKSFPEQPLTFTFNPSAHSLEVSSDFGKYAISYVDAAEYPKAPDVDATVTVELPAHVLGTAIAKTLFAAGNDDLRPVMSGVFFQLTPESLTFVATDAHKLVRYRRSDFAAPQTAEFIMPKKPLNLLKATLGSNRVDVRPLYEERTGRVLVFAALDNLVKGMAGQAVQNLNLMLGLPEETALPKEGLWP